jgi:hypothetical protein
MEMMEVNGFYHNRFAVLSHHDTAGQKARFRRVSFHFPAHQKAVGLCVCVFSPGCFSFSPRIQLAGACTKAPMHPKANQFGTKAPIYILQRVLQTAFREGGYELGSRPVFSRKLVKLKHAYYSTTTTRRTTPHNHLRTIAPTDENVRRSSGRRYQGKQ